MLRAFCGSVAKLHWRTGGTSGSGGWAGGSATPAAAAGRDAAADKP